MRISGWSSDVCSSDLPAGRDANGYRRFEQEAVRRVRFIKRAQEAGFSLKDINGLLSFRASPTTSCPDIRELALLKIDEIDAKIAALARMRTVLATWAEECRDTATISECPILDALEAREEQIGRGSCRERGGKYV